MKKLLINRLLLAVILTMMMPVYWGCQSEVSGPASTAVEDFTKVPEGFPAMTAPADNPVTSAKAALGRRLFYEVRLSKNMDFSCTQCHKRAFAFTNAGAALGEDPDGNVLTRNVLPIFNTGYYKEYFWDGSANSLEDMMSHDLTLPFIFNNDTNEIQKRLEADSLYQEMFRKAFGQSARPQAYLVAKALATFVRTIVSGDSRYDKYRRGDKSALNESEVRGMNLFFSSRTNCSSCHSGILFTDGKYHNTGTTTHYFDRGRFYVTGRMDDRGKFRTPTLRNIELTAPYLHEGEFRTLEDIINNYDAGGRAFINKDTLMKPLNLSQKEKADLVAFLKSLTDQEFLKNPLYNKP